MPLSALNQDGFINLEVFLHALLVGKLQRGPLGLALDKLIVHQVFAYELDVETRILHPPDLTGFEGLYRDSAFLIHVF